MESYSVDIFGALPIQLIWFTGHILKNTRPTISASGTGPYSLESVELLTLSPCNQT